jgi:hypothetical protein
LSLAAAARSEAVVVLTAMGATLVLVALGSQSARTAFVEFGMLSFLFALTVAVRVARSAAEVNGIILDQRFFDALGTRLRAAGYTLVGSYAVVNARLGVGEKRWDPDVLSVSRALATAIAALVVTIVLIVRRDRRAAPRDERAYIAFGAVVLVLEAAHAAASASSRDLRSSDASVSRERERRPGSPTPDRQQLTRMVAKLERMIKPARGAYLLTLFLLFVLGPVQDRAIAEPQSLEPASPLESCTAIPVELTDTLDTGSARTGDVFHFRTIDTIVPPDNVTIPRNSAGYGVVAFAEAAAAHGKPGALIVEARYIVIPHRTHYQVMIDSVATSAVLNGNSGNVGSGLGIIPLPFVGTAVNAFNYLHAGKNAVIRPGTRFIVVPMGNLQTQRRCRL